MRVTQAEMYRNFLSDLETLNENLTGISRQVSSGKKLTQLSDSPGGSADLVSLTELASKINLYRTNADTGSYFLGVTESALSEVNDLVTSVYSKGSEAASEAVGADARATLALEIRSLRDQILALANSQARGRYIFAGSAVTSAPFVIAGDSVANSGNDDVNSVLVSDGVEVQQGVPVSEAFDSIFAAIQTLLVAIDGNDVSGIGTALSQFSSALSDLGQVRGQVGVNLSLLDNVKANLDSQEASLKQRRSGIEDADMAKAIVQLNQTQTALKAAISAGGSILSQPNLFDILG